MSRIIFLVSIAFFGLWGWFLSPVAQAQTCGGGNGECKTIAECTGTQTTDPTACGNLLICCIGSGSGNNQGTACTASSGSGICEFSDQCTPANSFPSPGCFGGTICCVTSGGGGNNQGDTCSVTVNGSNRSGICEFTSQCSAANSVNSPTCTGGTTCCITSGAGGNENAACSVTVNGSNQSGVCKFDAQCSAANRVPSPTCTGGTTCCVASGSSDPGGATGNCGDPTKFEKIAGVCFPRSSYTGLSDKSVLQILTALISWLLAIFGLIAILGFIISGLQYLMSAGDEQRAETAKRNMQYAVIGVIVALSGWVIIQAVDNLLKADPRFLI